MKPGELLIGGLYGVAACQYVATNRKRTSALRLGMMGLPFAAIRGAFREGEFRKQGRYHPL